MRYLKKWAAMLLTVCMIINMMPLSVLAENDMEGQPVITEIPVDSKDNAVTENEAAGFSGSLSNGETGESLSVPEEVYPENASAASDEMQHLSETVPFSEEEQSEISEDTQEEIATNDESSTASERTISEIGDSFADSFIAVLNKNNISAVIEKGTDGIITLTIGEGQERILELLSQQTQTVDSNYQRWNINFTITGGLTLTDSYQGLGDADFPFMGKFTNQSITIKSSKTIFKALDARADLNSVKINWTGVPNIPVLAQTLVADAQPQTIRMSLAKASSFSPYIGQMTGGTGAVTLSSLDYSEVGNQSSSVEYSGDIGLVCGSMSNGTKLQIGELKLPGEVALNLKGSGNVGSLVGSMGERAEIKISQNLTVNTTLQGENAGGLVGFMNHAGISFAENVSASVSADLTATEAAGGIAGVVVTETGPLAGTANVVLQSVNAKGEKNSGVLYGACTADGSFDPLTGVRFAKETRKAVSGSGSCGGVFGTLTLNGNGKCIFGPKEGDSYEISSTLISASNTTLYGGMTGTLNGADRKNALVVNACKITSNVEVGNDTANYPKYIGGIIAKQEKATVDAKSSEIAVYNPKTKTASDRGFGGVSAYVGDDALLIADTMKVFTNDYLANPGGGGIAGSTHKRSIVYLKSKLDLSECQLTSNATSGQIVGLQECSLIYAPNVTITRFQTGTYSGLELDDIGNYGEMYRMQGFLNMDANTYATSFPFTLSSNDGVYTLSKKSDYACFALAWQSRGCFSTVSGIDNDNWTALKSSNIQLGGDLNLTGYGIGGLTRDVDSEEDTFSGTFNGNGYKIILDIGAENQANTTKVSKGDGRIYWHSATGLFAVLSSDANVQSLTLEGNVRVSNNKLGASTGLMKSGGLAALLSYGNGNGNGSIRNVSTKVQFDAVCNGDTPLYIGGLIGLISNTEADITLEGGTTLAAIVAVTHSGNGNYNHIGGVIGSVAADANVEFVCNGATLGGRIEYTNTPNNIYAGGLVGTILPQNGSGKRTIMLESLTVNGFSLSGSAKERMGGILGGIWADTDVTVNGLTVSNATLTANGAAALGGLVYRASGKWTVSSADLSGLTITARNASALGVLVCQGGPYKEPINNASGSYTNIDGLYLEMEEYWKWNSETKKGYEVPGNIAFDESVFDEFVAYTAYADRSSNTPNYQITANGSGIISLKTENNTINMSEGDRNTYANRTTVGQSKQTNLYSRYYYNLPEVMKACSGGSIDTAAELLIWSVCRYSAPNLKNCFSITGIEQLEAVNTIGGASAKSAISFDMNGFSYYPINITNEDITVQYANVKFYNDDIETKEAGNKSTRGDAKDHSQHYTMHCALFLDFVADLTNITTYENRTMTANGVNFSGSVGVVNGGSGALICGTVKGDTKGGNSSICTVVLADEDRAEKAISLNGLSVTPEGNYTPALINQMGSYAGLKANYIITTNQQTKKAGSSLIGDVGGQGATNVSVEFSGTIKLAEKVVFSKAVLLNSLRYENGSAIYNFKKNKDYNEENEYVHNATHGQELSTSVEYVGKQGCYYDGYGTGYYVSASGSFDSQNDFSAYLPYVALSPATSGPTHPLADGWHELAVNVLSSDLMDGCGTYGHPYQVDANLLKEAANYINTGTASAGWSVRISVDDTYHTEEGVGEVLLTYTGNEWKVGEETYTKEKVRQYLQNAYYVIKENIELSDFKGIGADKDWAFTGVIKGKEANTTVTLSGGSTAFIKYSYGSVVRDLKIVMNQSPTLNREIWTRGNEEQAPKTFFGGVIGCVLGGDNIIENVTVSNGESFNIRLTGTGTHLVPVGGYVGVIAGGGVIFRGSYSDNTGVTGTDAQLYQNSIIGRVLGGYAFYEGTGEGEAPDNGDKNYKINKINPSSGSDLSWKASTLTVNNAQGLVLLSAIVSSGAGSKSSNAYAKGKARNAAYDQIGGDTEPEDYAIARQDAGKVWNESQVPYLLKKYASTSFGEICSSGTDGIAIEFAENGAFDMQNYKNGYRGLSARYVSNAAFVEKESVNAVDATLVVLRISSFDGKNTNVQNINMDVREYDDDDFHAASLGGIFNIVWTRKKSGGTENSVFAQNLTIMDCNVSLQYVNTDGVVQKQADTSTFSDADGLSCVTVGGFIGSVSDIDVDPNMGLKSSNYLFSDLHVNGGEIKGSNCAGGLIGASAMTNSAVTGCPGILISNSKKTMFGPSFLNCSYSEINVTAKLAAGGLIGYVFAGSGTAAPQFTLLGMEKNNNDPGCYASCTVTRENVITGVNSTICAEARRGVAGGVFGAVGMRVRVNDSEVDKKTGLSVSGNEIKKLCLQTVTIKSSMKDEHILRGDNSKNGPTPNGINDDAAAAGIVGRIGNVNPTCFYDINLKECSVSTGKWPDTSKINNFEYSGGIVGYGYTNTSITIQRCRIENNSSIDSKNSGGFLGYGYVASGFILHMSDCKIENSEVHGNTYAGGLVGKAAGKYYLFNIMIKNTSIKGPNTGRLFGWMNINAANNDFVVNAAGISVYASNDGVTMPKVDGKTDPGKNYIGFISYANYAGTERKVDEHQSPYVTVNPNFTLFTLEGAEKMLTGDAVGKIEGDTYGSVAARIWADNKTGATEKKNLVSYPKVSEIVKKNVPEVSTFKDVQGCGPEDLPVLVLKGADNGVIENYLDVITNGGYSEASKASGEQVKLKEPEVYYYNENTRGFTKADADKLAQEPASIYLGSDKKMHVRNSSFDNTRNRFSLVEASFKVKVNGQDRTYTVSVPIVVIRELQYNFMSTFSYGTEFQAATFENLKTHVLESTGNPFTAYLTYQYNYEKNEYVDYDWQSYMDDGGNMLNMDKVLSFSSGLPSDTQIMLVDCQNGNRAYQYTTVGTNTNAKTDVLLSSFTSVSDGTPFQASMAEILGVTSRNSESGKYVVETEVSKATIRLKDSSGEYIYYRPLSSSETTESMRYDLTVPDLSTTVPKENYYLVITVPRQEANPNFYINGSLSSSLRWSMPSNGTWIHRYDGTDNNVGNNDESTYQISTGYKQELSSTAEKGAVINLASADTKMQVKAKDTITFSNRQVYDDKDQLYMKLTVDLQEASSDSTDVTEIQFPAGTTGRVYFYIQDADGRYYFLQNGDSWGTQSEKIEAVSYDWASQGSNMELLLSKDGSTALDLSGVRRDIKGSQTSGESKIIITAEMDIDFNSQEVLKATVPGSEKDGADKWVQLHYTGRISTQERSLTYSTVREIAGDNAKYYRGVKYESILSIDATSISQLGINPLELVPEYLTTFDSKKASRIDLMAALNLSNLQDIESVLANTESITFTLSLLRGGKGEYTDVNDATNYIGFEPYAWSWTIPKDQFYDNQIVTNDIFDGTQFTMPITAYVFTNQKDYANYKIKLNVQFNGSSNVSVNDTEAYVIYTFACIKPEFYEPATQS